MQRYLYRIAMILATIGRVLLAQRLFHALMPSEHIATNLGKNWVIKQDGKQLHSYLLWNGLVPLYKPSRIELA